VSINNGNNNSVYLQAVALLKLESSASMRCLICCHVFSPSPVSATKINCVLTFRMACNQQPARSPVAIDLGITASRCDVNTGDTRERNSRYFVAHLISFTCSSQCEHDCFVTRCESKISHGWINQRADPRPPSIRRGCQSSTIQPITAQHCLAGFWLVLIRVVGLAERTLLMKIYLLNP